MRNINDKANKMLLPRIKSHKRIVGNPINKFVITVFGYEGVGLVAVQNAMGVGHFNRIRSNDIESAAFMLDRTALIDDANVAVLVTCLH